MCMLFICCNHNPQPDEFSLILTSIRDEYFMRPTEMCKFWDQNPNIIGGMDLEEGREGGTWLAMHKTTGKIGVLLNVLQPIESLIVGKKHRGFLVPEFLESGLNGPEFLTSLSIRSSEFADFLMVTLDVGSQASIGSSPSTVTSSFFTNMESNSQVTSCTGDEILAFGNNLPEKPWIKTIVGRKIFQNISQRNIKIKRKKTLVHELFDMINDDTEYFPDEQLISDGRGYDEEYLRALSSLRVRMPTVGFGTRTQSIILIDQKGRVDFMERTLNEDSLLLNSPSYRNWPKRVFNFRISPLIPDTTPSRPSFLLPIYSLSSRL